MTDPAIIAVLIALILGASAIITASILKGTSTVTISPDVQAQLDRIEASTAAIPGMKQAAHDAGVAEANQSHADDVAAITTAADNLSGAVGA